MARREAVRPEGLHREPEDRAARSRRQADGRRPSEGRSEDAGGPEADRPADHRPSGRRPTRPRETDPCRWETPRELEVRAVSASNLVEQFGGSKEPIEDAVVPCAFTGVMLAGSKEAAAKHGLDMLTRDKLIVGPDGGGYQLPNLIPVSPAANQSHGDRPPPDWTKPPPPWGDPAANTRTVISANTDKVAASSTAAAIRSSRRRAAPSANTWRSTRTGSPKTGMPPGSHRPDPNKVRPSYPSVIVAGSTERPSTKYTGPYPPSRTARVPEMGSVSTSSSTSSSGVSGQPTG